MLTERPQVSVIVPTYCEAANLPALVQRIGQSLQAVGLSYEILVIDDNSPDATHNVCAQLSTGHPIRLLVRQHERGLASAAIHGCDNAQGNWFVIMDADLSHPPERIPALVKKLASGEADFVLGSRYTSGGSTSAEWSVLRRLNSQVATTLARPLTQLSDPMAGFFALPSSLYQTARPKLNPLGYKIGLELLVKAEPRRPAEIPIHFDDRQHGRSKLDWCQQLLYLRHLLRLYRYRFEAQIRPIRFLIVGGVGAVIDLTVYLILFAIGWSPSLARALAVWVAMTCNYVGNGRFTFLPARPLSWCRYVQFCASCLAGAVVNWLVSLCILRAQPWEEHSVLLGAVIGIAAGASFNYYICRTWVFTSRRLDVPADDPLPTADFNTKA